MNKHKPIEKGTKVWMIKATNLKTPKHINIEQGFVAYADNYQYWITFQGKKHVSAQPEELFLSYKDALEYVVIWLRSHLDVYAKELERIESEAKE